MKTIAVVIGTRPEAIKLLPLVHAFNQVSGVRCLLVFSGQHKEMVQPLFELFGVSPDLSLDVMVENQTLSGLTARLVAKLDEAFLAEKPDMIVVQGDTTTCMVASLVAHYHKIKIAHVEAGLRTYDLYSPFPEEANRRITDILADIQFTPTDNSTQNLLAEKSTAEIHQVGNTVVDALELIVAKVNANLQAYQTRFSHIVDPQSRLILVTSHRRENFGTGMQEICGAIAEIADSNPTYRIVFPVHLNPNVRTIVHQTLGQRANVHLLEPLRYDELVFFMSQSHIILTDSGGIQEEAPTLNKPIVVMRDTTERPEGVAAGCAVLAGANKSAILAAFERINGSAEVYQQMAAAPNPYGDGQSCRRIASICLAYLQKRSVTAAV